MSASPDEYGKDFTKGVYVSVPLIFLVRPEVVQLLTPLTRDGGRQLGRKFGLYDMTSETGA